MLHNMKANEAGSLMLSEQNGEGARGKPKGSGDGKIDKSKTDEQEKRDPKQLFLHLCTRIAKRLIMMLC